MTTLLRPRRLSLRSLLALSLLVILMIMCLPAPKASAHAFLTDSTPGDGAVLSSAPASIDLKFSESVVVSAMTIDLVDSTGKHYRATSIRLASDPDADTEEPSEVVATLPPLGRDAYRLSWQTLSSDDLHRTNGILVFGIGQAVTAAGFAEPRPAPDEVALRTLIFVSLALAVGGLLARRLVSRAVTEASDPLDRAARRCVRWSIAGGITGIVGCTGLLLVEMVSAGSSVSDAINGPFGWHSLLRIGGFAGLVVAAWVPVRTSTRLMRVALVVAGSAAVAVDSALLGHSGAGTSLSLTRVVADAAHLISAGLWSGTLLLAVIVAIPAARRADGTSVQRMLRSFGGPAAVCVAVMIASGLYLASAAAASVDALLLTFYGRVLLIKVFVVLIICCLGVINHRRVRRSRSTVPGRTVALEAGAAVLVLGLAATLTSSQPAMEPQFVNAAAPAAVSTVSALAGDLQEAVDVRPNSPGRNVMLIDVYDTRRPSPAPIRGVTVVVSRPGAGSGPALPAVPVGDGRWAVTSDIAPATNLTITVTVRRPGMSSVSWSYPWALRAGSALPTAPAVVSRTPISGLLKSLSLSALIVFVLAGAWWTRAWRRRRTAVQEDMSTGGAASVPRPAPAEEAEPAPIH